MEQNTQLWKHYFPQFFNNPDPEVRSLMQTATLVNLPAGKTLFYPGAPCQNYVYVTRAGIIPAY